MKVLLVHPANDRGVAIFRALRRRKVEVVWCPEVSKDTHSTTDGSLDFDAMVLASPGGKPELDALRTGDIDVAIIAEEADPLDAPGNPEEDCLITGADLTQRLNEQGIVCCAISAIDDTLARLKQAGAVHGLNANDVKTGLSEFIGESLRLARESANDGTLKALSLYQPAAWAIFGADKDVENRFWPTKVRGTIAIHAGQEPDGYFDNQALWIARLLRRESNFGVKVPRKDALPRQAIIGLVDITDCVTDSGSPWFEGPFGFKLTNARLLPEPIPCSMKRRFYSLPPAIVRQISAQLR